MTSGGKADSTEYVQSKSMLFPIIMIIIEVILVNLSQILRGAGKEPRGEGSITLYYWTESFLILFRFFIFELSLNDFRKFGQVWTIQDNFRLIWTYLSGFAFFTSEHWRHCLNLTEDLKGILQYSRFFSIRNILL